MPHRPPIVAARQLLPFQDRAFSWETFEDFFIDFLNARPVIGINDGGTRVERRVIRARPYGRRGDNQHGIDILAEMEGGEVWDFQCKHYKKWGPAKTTDTIGAYARNAARKFLLITCQVSEETRAIVEGTPGWALWDGREITRRFLEETPKVEAARILFTHFGDGWPEALLGVSSDAPLISAEAKFNRFLRPGRTFHHRLKLVGRRKWLQQLDDFVRDPKARVLLLTGLGGLGKSRLLLEWSRQFARRHREHTLRFVSDNAVKFGPWLEDAQEPLVLAFDDAHRFGEVRDALFPALLSREHVKLVLSLRPAPIGQVRAELLQAGFDSTEIVEPDAMKHLRTEDALTLAERALGRQLAARHRHFLASVSRDCPLVAVLGAELLRREAIPSGDLLNAAEFQTRVFEGMLGDAAPIEDSFGREATRDFLRLLALTGPAKLDAEFYRKAAAFIGDLRPDHVSQLRDALDEAGFLHTSGAGTRITPDLLSDHLAYQACYDRKGNDRTFAERLLAHFSADQFPRLMQHLAEAEWRALVDNPKAESVVEPLWQWFRKRFEESPFHERSSQIHEWANIAVLQPERSLELAELALSLTSAPASENQSLNRGDWNTHDRSVEWLPKLLQNVAEYHPSKVGHCLDLLWQIGRDKPSPFPHNEKSHPISIIGGVMTFKYGKFLQVLRTGLDWLEALLANDDWLKHLHKPSWLLSKFFGPIFATSFEENWSTGRTIHMQSHLLDLAKTTDLRDRTLGIFRKLLTLRSDLLAVGTIGVLEDAIDIARLRTSATVPPVYTSAWDVERRKALQLIEEIISNFSEPIVHYRIRKMLLPHIRYGWENPDFRDTCRALLTRIPNTIDFQLARATLGSYYDEFERPMDSADSEWLAGKGSRWQLEAKARWESFIWNVAEKLVQKYRTPSGLLDHVAELKARWQTLGETASFHSLFTAIPQVAPSIGVPLAEALFEERYEPLLDAFDAVAV